MPSLTLPPLSEQDEALVAELSINFSTGDDEQLAALASPAERQPVSPNSVVIVTWMKSGTTLSQQLIYQLLVLNNRVPTDPTGADFYDVNDAIPFIELSPDRIVKPVHRHTPNTLKTHCLPHELHGPQWSESRFIVVVREGRSAMRSLVDFCVEWSFNLSVPQHLRAHFYDRVFRIHMLGCPDAGHGAPQSKPHRWFAHTKAWLEDAKVRDRSLYLAYEEIVSDMTSAVQKMAKFLNIPAPDEVVAEVVRRSQRENMQTEARFRSRRYAQRYGLSEDGGGRVRPKDLPGYADMLTEETERDYLTAYKTAFGVETFAEICEILYKRNENLAEFSKDE